MFNFSALVLKMLFCISDFLLPIDFIHSQNELTSIYHKTEYESVKEKLKANSPG